MPEATRLTRYATTILERSRMMAAGAKIIGAFETIHELGAFFLITAAVMLTKFNTARKLIHPMIRAQVARAGTKLMPMILFLAVALGLVVIGQTVFIVHKYGAPNVLGVVMVSVVVRELGPLLAAMIVLARIGTANIVELGTARALGQVEALEALGIDPIHFLVVPRVVGMALSIFSLTIYLIVFSLLSGYLVAFMENVPVTPSDYFDQLGGSLLWEDFALLALKTIAFGVLISMITCYEGLAKPVRLDKVGRATTRAVGECVVGIVMLDALFMVVYIYLSL
jgi:phospholipid/cholesterol/gamma-HCH transport system permease protein